MCLNPIILLNRRKVVLKKPSPFGNFFSVPCGSCVQCLEHKISAQVGRLLAHTIMQPTKDAYFVTFTLRDDFRHNVNLQYKGVNKKHIAPLIKAIQNNNYFCGNKLTYFFTSEYGSKTDRPHYHALFWGFPTLKDCEDFVHGYYDHGNITISLANSARFNYVANSHVSKCSHVPYYLPDIDDGVLDKCNKPFVKCSRGLGFEFVEKHKYELFRNPLIRIDGRSYPMYPSLVSHLAHCLGYDDEPMMFYDRNLKFVSRKEYLLSNGRLTTYFSDDDVSLFHYLGIDYTDFDFSDYDDRHRMQLYINNQIDEKIKKFKDKYSTKKTNSYNV